MCTLCSKLEDWGGIGFETHSFWYVTHFLHAGEFYLCREMFKDMSGCNLKKDNPRLAFAACPSQKGEKSWIQGSFWTSLSKTHALWGWYNIYDARPACLFPNTWKSCRHNQSLQEKQMMDHENWAEPCSGKWRWTYHMLCCMHSVGDSLFKLTSACMDCEWAGRKVTFLEECVQLSLDAGVFGFFWGL